MKLRTTPVTIGLMMVSLTAIPAATIYWDGGDADITAFTGNAFSDGGNGTWDTTLKNWDKELDQAHVAWVNANNDTASFAGAAGTVTLGANVTAASLLITGAYTIANAGFDMTLSGTGTTVFGNAAITLSGAGKLLVTASQTWSNSSGIMTVSCPVDTGDKLLTLETKNNNLDVTGRISGSGGLTVKTTGVTTAIGASNGGTPANPTLNSTNDYTGTTTVNGFIWLNSGGLGAFGTDPSDIMLNIGGFRLTGTDTVTRGLNLTGACGISKTAGTTTLNGKITGPGSFNISGNFGTTSPVVLAAANDFTGDCINGPDGIVRPAHVDALSKASITWADNNGRSAYDFSTNNLAYVIGGLKSVTNKSGNLNLGTGLAGGGTGAVSFGANNQTNTYVGILSGAAGFTKIGTGTQTLVGENTYTGNTVVAEGTLKLGKITGQTGVSCTTGTTGTNVKRLTVPSSANLYIGQAVSGSLIGANARITGINTTTQVSLTVDNVTPATATTADFADIPGSIITSPVIDVRTGATFDVSTYPWTLDAAQTLGGTGTVVGAITAAGTIAPGLATTGTLATGDVALTGSYACTLDGANCDKLAAGALTLTGAKLSFTATSPPTAASYVIATYTGAAPSPFATVENLPGGYVLDYATTGQIRLVGGVTPPYDSWASAKGLTAANNGKAQDPDGDGANNLLEFALGGDPLGGGNKGLSLAKVQDVAGSQGLTLTIAVRSGATFAAGPNNTMVATKDGVGYRIEGAKDLAAWTDIITEVIPAIPLPAPNQTPPAGYEYHTFKTAGPVTATPADFIRVRVSE